MPKRPFDLERYPHTHYHDYDQNWIYKEIGILKAWLFSLTKLWAKLAEADAEKYAEILDEINRLIEKIQALIDLLTAAIKQLRDSFDAFATCLENLLSSMDKHIEDIEKEIEKIEEEIDNIYDLLKKILSQSFSTTYPTYNTDYSFQFYNGYYCQQDYNASFIEKQDTIIESPDERYHSVKYIIVFNSFHSLRNNTEITAASESYPHLAHGDDNPEAYICDIIIKDLANMTIDSIEDGEGVWNMYPTSARASWIVNVNGFVQDNNIVRLIPQTIADGFNSQYLTYISQGFTDALTFGNLNTTITINAHYVETI